MIRMEELYDIGFEKERESKSYESRLKRGRIERKSYCILKGRVRLKARELKRKGLKESLLWTRKNCITISVSKGCD